MLQLFKQAKNITQPLIYPLLSALMIVLLASCNQDAKQEKTAEKTQPETEKVDTAELKRIFEKDKKEHTRIAKHVGENIDKNDDNLIDPTEYKQMERYIKSENDSARVKNDSIKFEIQYGDHFTKKDSTGLEERETFLRSKIYVEAVSDRKSLSNVELEYEDSKGKVYTKTAHWHDTIVFNKPIQKNINAL